MPARVVGEVRSLQFCGTTKIVLFSLIVTLNYVQITHVYFPSWIVYSHFSTRQILSFELLQYKLARTILFKDILSEA